jgi:hypothetical protein
MTTPTQRLETAKERLLTTSLAVHRARQACNGEHDARALDRLLKAEEQARKAHAEAVFNYGVAFAAVHGSREVV